LTSKSSDSLFNLDSKSEANFAFCACIAVINVVSMLCNLTGRSGSVLLNNKCHVIQCRLMNFLALRR
jgi:hypothetical protein